MESDSDSDGDPLDDEQDAGDERRLEAIANGTPNLVSQPPGAASVAPTSVETTGGSLGSTERPCASLREEAVPP